jgi:hypothetical protein
MTQPATRTGASSTPCPTRGASKGARRRGGVGASPKVIVRTSPTAPPALASPSDLLARVALEYRLRRAAGDPASASSEPDAAPPASPQPPSSPAPGRGSSIPPTGIARDGARPLAAPSREPRSNHSDPWEGSI